jgi:adenylate kinase family enzyme
MSLDAQLPQVQSEPPLTLVELFALPGAGKSTVAEAFARQALVKTREDLSAEWANSSALERLAHVGRAFGKHRRLQAAMRLAAGGRLYTWESQSRLMRLVIKAEWLRSRSGAVVLDQGFLQDIWSIFLSGKSMSADPDLLCTLVRSLYEGIDTRIVVLDVDPTTASARVSARTHGVSRFEHMPERQRLTALEAASGLQQQIMEAARAAGLPVVVIDGSLPAAAVTDQLLALSPDRQARKIAERALPSPRRISVVGATGSGKTILAGQIAERLNLPLVELDKIQTGEGNGGPSGRDFDLRVSDLARADEWVIDGHYRAVRHLIWSRADLVVWLNYPLRVIALHLMQRFRRRHRARLAQADLPDTVSGESQLVTHQSASWLRRLGRLARTLRERKDYGRILRSQFPEATIVELRSVDATRRWLRDL